MISTMIRVLSATRWLGRIEHRVEWRSEWCPKPSPPWALYNPKTGTFFVGWTK